MAEWAERRQAAEPMVSARPVIPAVAEVTGEVMDRPPHQAAEAAEVRIFPDMPDALYMRVDTRFRTA